MSTESSEASPRTERAPPVATALAAPLPEMALTPQSPYQEPAPRRGRGTVVAIIGLSLLLGAGVVAILVGMGTLSLSSDPPAVPAPLAVPEAAVTVLPGAPTSNVSSVPTLVPSKPSPPGPPPGPGPGPRPTPSNRPSPVEDGGWTPPPFILPSSLPNILPIPIPSGFPTAIPSIFPPWPTAPVPPPPHASGTPI